MNKGSYQGNIYDGEIQEIMSPKQIKTTKIRKFSLKNFKTTDYCRASKASSELMLHRFYNGKRIEFPFSK